MKKLLTFIICLIIGLDIIDNLFLDNKLNNYIKDLYLKDQYRIITNENTLNSSYKYNEYSSLFKNTTNFYPKNKNELFDVYYTILNNGVDDFTFYCSESYKNCLIDINDLAKDSDTFTYINQLVHPYNSFKTINSNFIYTNNRVDVVLNKKYTSEDISKIDNKINEIINNLKINNFDSINDKIRLFHDYLADTNVYDNDKVTNNSKYNSDTAIGTLFEGHSTCSGYTDTMAIFLNKLGLENIKIISKKHTWNAVKLNNVWYHIDITWDDPIITGGGSAILHDYFLLTTDELLKKDRTQHNFDKELYNFIL